MAIGKGCRRTLVEGGREGGLKELAEPPPQIRHSTRPCTVNKPASAGSRPTAVLVSKPFQQGGEIGSRIPVAGLVRVSE